MTALLRLHFYMTFFIISGPKGREISTKQNANKHWKYKQSTRPKETFIAVAKVIIGLTPRVVFVGISWDIWTLVWGEMRPFSTVLRR